MTRYLIVRTSALGDIAQTFPVIAYLKAKDPQAQIDWIVEKEGAPLVASHPGIDRTLIVDTKTWRKNPFSGEVRSFLKGLRETNYDAVFDLQGNIKSALFTLAAKGTKIGFDRRWVAEWPNLLATHHKFAANPDSSIQEIYLAPVQGFFQDQSPFAWEPVLLKGEDPEFSLEGPTALVCPGSKWPNKELAPAVLAEFLCKIPYRILLSYGSKSEEELARTILAKCPRSTLLPKRTIPSLQRLMWKVDLVIAMDSLPLHLAATTPTKTFSAFGPSLGSRYSPKQDPYIQGPCPYGVTFSKRCPKMRTCETGACIKRITAEELLFSFSKN